MLVGSGVLEVTSVLSARCDEVLEGMNVLVWPDVADVEAIGELVEVLATADSTEELDAVAAAVSTSVLEGVDALDLADALPCSIDTLYSETVKTASVPMKPVSNNSQEIFGS